MAVNATFQVEHQDGTPAGAGHAVTLTKVGGNTVIYGPLTTDANGQAKKSVMAGQYDIYVDGVKDAGSPWGLSPGMPTINLPDVP